MKRLGQEEYHKSIQYRSEETFKRRFKTVHQLGETIGNQDSENINLEEKLGMLNKLLAKKFKHEAEINVDSSRMKKSETINMCIENILDIITKPASPSNNQEPGITKQERVIRKFEFKKQRGNRNAERDRKQQEE